MSLVSCVVAFKTKREVKTAACLVAAAGCRPERALALAVQAGGRRSEPGFSSRHARCNVGQGALQVGYPLMRGLELDSGDRIRVSAV